MCVIEPGSTLSGVGKNSLRCARLLALIGGVVWQAGLSAAPATTPPQALLIGEQMQYVTQSNDTLLDVARRFDAGYVEILIANPGIDPWLPGVGKTVVAPTQHLIPALAPGKARGVVINLPELRLYYFPSEKDRMPISFPIGIGDEGKDTPVGATTVIRKQPHPSWTPTRSEHEENPDLPATIGPGADNPMGDFALYLAWHGYAVHGTNKPDSIGRRDSHGCIRMLPEDVAALFPLVAVGTPVTIVNQPIKAGWVGNSLYLEVHPPVEDIDPIEQGQPVVYVETDEVEAAVNAAVAQMPASMTVTLNRAAIHTVALQRNGIPTVIGTAQSKSDQSKSDQSKSDQSKSDQSKSDQSKSD